MLKDSHSLLSLIAETEGLKQRVEGFRDILVPVNEDEHPEALHEHD